jgi:hypothetical protein
MVNKKFKIKTPSLVLIELDVDVKRRHADILAFSRVSERRIQGMRAIF